MADEKKVIILYSLADPDDEWSVQVLVQDGKLTVFEHKENEETTEVNYENVFMGLINLLNDKIAYEFLNEHSLDAMSKFLIERKSKLN